MHKAEQEEGEASDRLAELPGPPHGIHPNAMRMRDQKVNQKGTKTQTPKQLEAEMETLGENVTAGGLRETAENTQQDHPSAEWKLACTAGRAGTARLVWRGSHNGACSQKVKSAPQTRAEWGMQGEGVSAMPSAAASTAASGHAPVARFKVR